MWAHRGLLQWWLGPESSSQRPSGCSLAACPLLTRCLPCALPVAVVPSDRQTEVAPAPCTTEPIPALVQPPGLHSASLCLSCLMLLGAELGQCFGWTHCPYWCCHRDSLRLLESHSSQLSSPLGAWMVEC